MSFLSERDQTGTRICRFVDCTPDLRYKKRSMGHMDHTDLVQLYRKYEDKYLLYLLVFIFVKQQALWCWPDQICCKIFSHNNKRSKLKDEMIMLCPENVSVKITYFTNSHF